MHISLNYISFLFKYMHVSLKHISFLNEYLLGKDTEIGLTISVFLESFYLLRLYPSIKYIAF
jgi:hypothetical protein